MRSFDKKANIIIMTLYLFLVVYSFVFVFVTDNTVLLWIFIPVLLILLWFVSRFLLGLFSRAKIMVPTESDPKKNAAVFIVSSACAFLILMVWFAGYRPGSYQGDCINQFGQALSGKYNDWHPVWQTVLIYTIPMKITGNAAWAPTFFQMIWFALTVGYFTSVIYKYAGKAWAIGTFLYIMINPYTGQMLLYPWKDCAFAIAGALSMAMVTQIWFSKGKWADKWHRCILLGFLLACCTIFRHNAVLFTAMLMIGLIFVINGSSSGEKKFPVKWLIVAGSFALSFVIIKYPVYSALHVSHTPQSVVQAVGLPMAVIGNVTVETPEKLDEETAELVYSIADQSTWEECYELGNFGVMKYYSDIDLASIEKAGSIKITGLALKCIRNSPKASMKAVFALTDIVYGLDIKDEGYIGTQITDNGYGIINQGNDRIAHILSVYYKFFRLHGFNYFRQFAFALLALLVIMLAKCDLVKWTDWKKILICLGIITYSFGTMLLLTSADSRFFYIDYLICPLAIIILLTDNRDKQGITGM